MQSRNDPGIHLTRTGRRALLAIFGIGVLVVLLALAGRAGATVPPPEWDKSSITLTGQCLADGRAEFTVVNGGRDMAGPSDWREYEGGTLTAGGTFQLAAGGARTWTFGPNVGAIEFQADQRPGHPGSSAPRLTLPCVPTAVTLRTFSGSRAWLAWLRLW